MYEHQSGFRLLNSVATALMASTNDWYLNIDKGEYIGLIFVDLKKAFDTVDLAWNMTGLHLTCKFLNNFAG